MRRARTFYSTVMKQQLVPEGDATPLRLTTTAWSPVRRPAGNDVTKGARLNILNCAFTSP